LYAVGTNFGGSDKGFANARLASQTVATCPTVATRLKGYNVKKSDDRKNNGSSMATAVARFLCPSMSAKIMNTVVDSGMVSKSWCAWKWFI
jgi:hypothetical protein